jgi:hypothetical protein
MTTKHLADLGVNDRIILKRISKETGWEMLTDFIWLIIGTLAVSCKHNTVSLVSI